MQFSVIRALYVIANALNVLRRLFLFCLCTPFIIILNLFISPHLNCFGNNNIILRNMWGGGGSYTIKQRIVSIICALHMQTQNFHEVYYSCFGIFDRSYSNICINYMFANTPV